MLQWVVGLFPHGNIKLWFQVETHWNISWMIAFRMRTTPGMGTKGALQPARRTRAALRPDSGEFEESLVVECSSP